ncbi:MAG: PAS domain S-box protein [Chitinophagaceae bacterium]|nr:PAS domain S-box protein [Chitinophagaceae bacterium]
MKISTGKILLITLLLTAITVAIALYISVTQSKKINTTFLSVSNTQNILFFSEKLLSEVTQSELLSREFVLTGDAEHLTSFQKLKGLIQNDFDKIRRSTNDNKVQQKRLDTLSEYIRISLQTSDDLISSPKLVGNEEIIALISKSMNKDNMAAIKKLIDNIATEEQRLLGVRKNESIVVISSFRALLFLAFALLFILMMILVQKLRVEVIADREAYRIMQYNTLLMENIRDAVISTDKDLCIVSWNDKAERMFGWKEEEVKGKPILSVVKPGYKDEGRATIIKRVKLTGAWDGEINLEKKDGQKITASLSWSAIWTPNGRMRGSVTIARDVTPRKQLEEQLKRFNAKLGKQVEERKSEIKHVVERLVSSEKKYKQLFENNPLPMMMLGYPELNIIDVNEAAILQYGFPKEIFLKKNIKDIQVREQLLDFKDYIKEDIAGYQEAGVWKHRKIDDTIIAVEIFVHSMIIDGLKAKLVLAHDISNKIQTEKKQAEYLEHIRMLTGYLQEVRETERKNIAREIHDELGQQLTVLKMEIAWMVKKLNISEKDVEVKFTELLETIDGTMTAVRRICAELRPTVLDDIGLEAAMEWHVKQFQQATGITIKLNSATENLLISADIKTALFRIFQESLTNIARHANASAVSVDLDTEDGFITLTITDNGNGFDMAVADQKRTLGILGMKERSLALGGEYKINSKPGKGTTIKVSIPLMPSEEKMDILNKKIG